MIKYTISSLNSNTILETGPSYSRSLLTGSTYGLDGLVTTLSIYQSINGNISLENSQIKQIIQDDRIVPTGPTYARTLLTGSTYGVSGLLTVLGIFLDTFVVADSTVFRADGQASVSWIGILITPDFVATFQVDGQGDILWSPVIPEGEFQANGVATVIWIPKVLTFFVADGIATVVWNKIGQKLTGWRVDGISDIQWIGFSKNKFIVNGFSTINWIPTIGEHIPGGDGGFIPPAGSGLGNYAR